MKFRKVQIQGLCSINFKVKSNLWNLALDSEPPQKVSSCRVWFTLVSIWNDHSDSFWGALQLNVLLWSLPAGTDSTGFGVIIKVKGKNCSPGMWIVLASELQLWVKSRFGVSKWNSIDFNGAKLCWLTPRMGVRYISCLCCICPTIQFAEEM